MLFEPFQKNGLCFSNCIVMAPMTRSRTTQPGDLPNVLMATYYRQRATAGLIVSEGAPVSAVARGYSGTPGIYTPEHVAGWQGVTRAVHEVGGKIFIRLWHVGRRSHHSIAGQQPVSASAIKEPDQVFGPLPDGGFCMIETDTPRAMTPQDIRQTVADFVQAAKNAIDAGFDGVEVHAAHGYLFDQFLRTASNKREDRYGGSPENRMRFLLETLRAIGDAIGGHRVGVRLSPYVNEGFAADDPEIVALTLNIVAATAGMEMAYIHFSENIGRSHEVPPSFRHTVRETCPHPIIVAGKLTQDKAQALLDSGLVDLVAFGTPFVSNPDLVERFRRGWPLAPFDADARLTLYGGGEKGYIDYPPYAP